MEPLAISLMIQATRGDTFSALPHAPVEPVKTRHRSRPVRRATAAALHHLADLVEPRIA